MPGPPYTTGLGQMPDYYMFRAERRRHEARRYGLPVGVHGVPGEGSVMHEWEQEVLRLFEVGRVLHLRDWRMLSPQGRHSILRGRRCQTEPETARLLESWR